jgi:DNA-binding transcriptional regulator YiaG
MNKQKLVGVMHGNGDRQEDLAKAIGISPQRFNAKLNETDGAEFTQGEIKSIRERYNLSADEVDEIFFASVVS